MPRTSRPQRLTTDDVDLSDPESCRVTAGIDLSSDVSPLAYAVLEAMAAREVSHLSSNVFGGLVAALDQSRSDDWIGIYRVGSDGATLVAYRSFSSDDRDARRALLREIGLRIGATYQSHEFVWFANRSACCVWSSTDVRMTGTGLELSLRSGTVHTADVTAVVSFVADDYVHRGVRLQLLDGAEPILVDEFDRVAEMDPTYNQDNFALSDAGWVSALGRDFAAWLHVTHRDEAFPHGK